MMKTNEELPDIEQLGHHEFNLDTEEQQRLQEEGDMQVQQVSQSGDEFIIIILFPFLRAWEKTSQKTQLMLHSSGGKSFILGAGFGGIFYACVVHEYIVILLTSLILHFFQHAVHKEISKDWNVARIFFDFHTLQNSSQFINPNVTKT